MLEQSEIRVDPNICISGTQVKVFWDQKSVEPGRQFDTVFMKGLANSLVVTPLVTPRALQRMADPANLDKIDYVLLEWWLAYIFFKRPGFPVLRIMPIFCGTVGRLNGKKGKPIHG